MKPLTVEELKNLKVGDWVWVKDNCGLTSYCEIIKFYPDDLMLEYKGELRPVPYNTYGETWLAYKNKEQAEAEGEIVELPYNKAGENIYKIIVPIDSEPYIETSTVATPHTVYIFTDKSEAEAKLAELKGEK